MSRPEAISQGDAATRLGISRATVERWINQGRLNTIRTGERGGARRVLVDDTFHTAKDSPRKIPHRVRKRTKESLITEKASPGVSGQIPQATPTSGAAPETESLTPIRGEAARVPASDDGATESLADDSRKSLTPATEQESLIAEEAGRPAVATARLAGRLLEADLVSLTSPALGDQEPQRAPQPADPSRRRFGRRVAVGVLLVVAASACALVAYRSTQPASATKAALPPVVIAARGAQAKKVSRTLPPTARAAKPRGGHARLVNIPAPPRNSDRTKKRVAQPAPPAPTTPSRPHRQHPITPCQSTGICVPNKT